MEGGAIVCHDEKTKQRIDYLKNFGFAGETKVMAPGINSKMNEMQAALGLLQLKYHQSNIEKRQQIAQTYYQELKDIEGINLLDESKVLSNKSYAYFPIFIEQKQFGKSRDELYEYLKENNIYGRRYFFPLISQFPSYRGLASAKSENLPIAEEMTQKVICLPIYPSLDENNVNTIITLIKKYSH